MAAAAPALKAAGTNSWPSRLSLRATKSSPGTRLRVSIETPSMRLVGAPSGWPRVAAMRSGHCHSGSDIGVTLGEGGINRLVVGEGQHRGANDLPGLMALASDEQHVASSKQAHPGPDRLGAIANFAGRGATSQNFRPNDLRPLAARIVVRDDHNIRKPRGDAPHDRSLASVPVATTAEHAYDATGSKPAQRFERGRESVGLVGVIDDDEAAAHATHDLQAAGDALQLAKRRQHLICRLACGDGERG